MTISTFVRLLAGVVLFIFLARLLGPEDFGKLMYGFTLASLTVLVIEYGFSQQLLRDIGKAPEQVRLIMGKVLLAKLLLTILVLVSVMAVFALFPKSVEEQKLFYLLLTACTLASFADFLNVAFRGIGKFHEETKIATFSSLFHFAYLWGLAFLNADLITLAEGFVGSRCLNLALSWMAYHRTVGGFQWQQNKFKAVISTLKSGFPYAADTGFTSFFAQVDVVIVNYYLGPAAVGLYQAGMRFLQGATQFAPILGNVYLPAIAGCKDNLSLNNLSRKLNFQMNMLGVGGWLIFTFAGRYITQLVYNEKYIELNGLWSHFGLLLFLRYFAATQGVLLTANGSQIVRVWAQVIAFLVMVLISGWFITIKGLSGMLLTLSITTSTLIIIYLGNARLKRIFTGINSVSIAIISLIITISIKQLCEQKL